MVEQKYSLDDLLKNLSSEEAKIKVIGHALNLGVIKYNQVEYILPLLDHYKKQGLFSKAGSIMENRGHFNEAIEFYIKSLEKEGYNSRIVGNIEKLANRFEDKETLNWLKNYKIKHLENDMFFFSAAELISNEEPERAQKYIALANLLNLNSFREAKEK